jgi:hypothetical protein
VTATSGPIVHPEDLHITGRRSGGGSIHCPQDRIGAGLDAQLPGQATTSFTSQRVADGKQGVAVSARLPAIGRCHHRQSLCKDPATTILRPTIETMRPQTNPNHRALAREVTQRPAITTVYMRGAGATVRTRRVTRTGGDDHHHDATLMNYFMQRQARWIWKKRQRQRAGVGSHLLLELKTFWQNMFYAEIRRRSTKTPEDPLG